MGLRAWHKPRRLTAGQIDALFARQRSEDRIGVGIHIATALVACLLAGSPTSVLDWAALPVLVCFLVRMTGWHGMLEPLAFDRVVRALLAWGAWIGLSVAWSFARLHGGREWVGDIQTLRFLALPILLWPVLDRRRWLLLAVMAGIACGEASQIGHLLATKLHWAWFPYHRNPGRVSGWWDPVVGGSVLCAGLGMWLSAAMLGERARTRLAGACGAIATLACIGLTGTRGAWIGAGVVCIAAVGVAAWRVRPRSRVLAATGVVLAMLALGAGVAWVVAGPRIRERMERGVEEVRRAIDAEDYTTDTGMRIAMWRWALIEASERPIAGVGAGGYLPWARAHVEQIESMNAAGKSGVVVEANYPKRLPHAHAHSWYLHTLATLGLIGLGLLAWLVGGAVWAGLAARDVPRDFAWIDAAPALGIVGLAGAGLFDPITINQQSSYMFYLLVGLCLASRPRDVTVEGAGA